MNTDPILKSKSSGVLEKCSLIVTPYIESGRTLEALTKTFSPPLIGHHASYSGFFTVDETLDSNLFFWFFESQRNPLADPVIVHVRGGLGTSVLMSVFEDSGPYLVDENGLKERKSTWIRTKNVLYIDSPVGSGFSFCRSNDAYCNTDFEVAENLFSALTQFLKLFNSFIKNNALYLSGESYATKSVIILALMISERRRRLPVQVNLKGLFLGSPIIDPADQLGQADFLKFHGLLNDEEHRSMLHHERVAARAIGVGDFNETMYHIDAIYAKCCLVGYRRLWDIRDPNCNTKPKHWAKFVQTEKFRNSIHVGDEKFGNRIKLEMKVKNDVLRSVVEYLPVLLERYKIMMYAGEFDMLVVYDNLHDLLSKISWKGCANFGDENMQEWWIDGKLVGHRRSVENLTEVKISNANHMVVNSQPDRVYDLLMEFTS